MRRAPDIRGRSGRRSLWRNNAGSIALITALVMIPLTFALGMAYDFTMAQSRQDQIDGMADVAALGAVTPTMMANTGGWTAAKTQATNMFEGQIATVSGVVFQPANLTVSGGDVTSGSTVNRTVTVTYTAGSQNVFATLLGMNTFPLKGSSTATSSTSPNIDFYLMLDTSPSMEIAATTAGIQTMEANTTSQESGGCAFGCHESNPAADNLGNPNGEDNYALARALNVPLRIDLVNQATQNLMTLANTTAAENGAAYRAAIYTMDFNFSRLQKLTSNLTTAKASAANIAALEVYDNNCVTQWNCNSDEDTYIDTGLSDMNAAMPNPGSGTNNRGDTPQEVLFVVTDGLNDENVNGTRVYAPIGADTSWCTTIKNRGIRIAVLYTTYYPLTGEGWYDTYVAPVQPNIATDAQNCASPGLFYEVSTDGDISAALASLFEKAVATARLTH